MLREVLQRILALRRVDTSAPEKRFFPHAETILPLVSPHTMVHETGLAFTVNAVLQSISEANSGVVIECGVWRGGCSLAVLLAQKYSLGRVIKPVHLFDSFEGLPEVTARDGSLAKEWQKGHTDTFFDNCKADEGTLRELFKSHELREGQDFHIHRGWFADTVPSFAQSEACEVGISVLRLDGDWYESTLTCLEALEPKVLDGGTVILDDYYAWDGCARATHDYLSHRDLPYRIKSLPHHFAAYFEKHFEQKSFNAT